LATEIERYRYLPDEYGNCPGDLQLCGDGGCGTAEQCETRLCSYGFFCESRQQCVYDEYECPTCTETSPFFCSVSNSCIASEADCAALCDQYEDQRWCDYWNQCQYIFDHCPDIGGDDDGGVPVGGFGGFGGFGGMGGAAGFPVPID